MPPNVLCVVLDTARRDAFEPYGAPAGATPAIAQLASRGAAPRHVYSTASWTLPSHASMLTGLMPREIGLTQAPQETPQSSRPVLERHRERLLPEVLRRAGYDTRAATANLWVSPHCGFDIGFERFHYVEPRAQLAEQAAGEDGRRASLAWMLAGVRSREDDGAAEVLEALRGWTAEEQTKPFFWFVNLVECHSPYLPPRPWNDLGPVQRARAGLDAHRHQSFGGVIRISGGKWDVSDESLERMRHLYSRAASYADSWLASVLELLDSSGRLDDTLVLVTSDHGENLGENKLLGHALSLDERLTGVPFVAAGPAAPADVGVRSLVDLPRMITEAAEVTDHPYETRLPDGVAVAEFDPPASRDHPKLRAFVEKEGLGEQGLDRLSVVLTSASDGRHKLVLRNGEQLVYDLRADPLEERPLEQAAAATVAPPLRTAIESVTAAPAAPMPDAPAGAGDASPVELAELERQMKLLGYM